MGFIVNGFNTFFYHDISKKNMTFEDLVKIYTRDKIAHIFSRETYTMKNIEKELKELSKKKLDQIIAIKIDKKLTYKRFRDMIRKLDMDNCIFLLFKEVHDSVTKNYTDEYPFYTRRKMIADITITDKENQELISETQTSFMLFPKSYHKCYIIKTRNSCMKNTRTVVGDIWTNNLYTVSWFNFNTHGYFESYVKTINKENALRISYIEQRYRVNYIDPDSEVKEVLIPNFLTYKQAIEMYGKEYEKDGDI